MALEPNALITTTDINTMGFAPISGRPAGTNQNQTKGRIEGWYQVNTNASPWSSYPANRLPTRVTALPARLGCVQGYDYFYAYANGECGQADEIRQALFFFTDGNGEVITEEEIKAYGLTPPNLSVNWVREGFGYEYPLNFTTTFQWGVDAYPYAFNYYTRGYVVDPYDNQCLGYWYEYWTTLNAPYSYCGPIWSGNSFPTVSLMNPVFQNTWADDLLGASDVIVPLQPTKYNYPHRVGGANTYFTIPSGLQVRNFTIRTILGQLIYDGTGVKYVQGSLGKWGPTPASGFCYLAQANYIISFRAFVANSSVQTQYNSATQVTQAGDPKTQMCDFNDFTNKNITFTNTTGSNLQVRWYGNLNATTAIGLRKKTLAPGQSITRCVGEDSTGAAMYFAPYGVTATVIGECFSWSAPPDDEICYFGIWAWITTAGNFTYDNCLGQTVLINLSTGLQFVPVCLKWRSFQAAGVPFSNPGVVGSWGYSSWCTTI